MEERKIRHLPVMDGGKVIGIVTDRDLRQYFKRDGDLRVEKIMTMTPYCVRIGTPLEDVLTTMDEQKIGSAIVVTAADGILGIFTTTDAVRLLRRLLKEDPTQEFSKWSIEDVFEKWDGFMPM
jgi:acetoin utilization protein AcuB